MYKLIYQPEAEVSAEVATFPEALPVGNIQDAVRGLISGLHKADKKAGRTQFDLREYKAQFNLTKIDKTPVTTPAKTSSATVEDITILGPQPKGDGSRRPTAAQKTWRCKAMKLGVIFGGFEKKK